MAQRDVARITAAMCHTRRLGAAMRSRAAVDALVTLLDEAFEGNDEHALLANVRDVDESIWRWVPAGGGRSIADIFYHAASVKVLYAASMFRQRLDYDDPVLTSHAGEDRASMVAWSREVQRVLRERVAALSDGELGEARGTPWGEPRPTGWLVGVLIQHDFYHAGEINHVRALRQGNDRWAWEQ